MKKIIQIKDTPILNALKCLLILVFNLYFTSFRGHSQQYKWAKGLPSPLFNTINSSSISPNGKLLVTGQFQNTTEFPSGSLISAGSRDVFISEYDSNGNNLWTKRYGGAGYEEPFGIKAMPNGQIMICGQLRGNPIFGNLNISSKGLNDAFLLQTDSVGNPLWLQTIGGFQKDVAFGVDVDSDFNSYVGGFFQDSVSIGGQWIKGTGFHNLFVASFNPQGTLRWFHSFASETDNEILDLDVSSNRVLIAGFFSGSLQFGNEVYTASGQRDGFLATYDLAGDPNWFMKVGGAREDFLYSVEENEKGQIFATGSSMGGSFGNLSFNPTSANWLDAIVLSCDTLGNPVWLTHAGTSTNHSQGNHLAVGDHSIYVTGTYKGQLAFSNSQTLLSSSGNFDSFTCRFSLDGQLHWATKAGSSGDDGTKAISIYNNSIYIAGDAGNGVSFGPITVGLGGSSNGIVAKLKDTVSMVSLGYTRNRNLVNVKFVYTDRGLILEGFAKKGILQLYDFQGRVIKSIKNPEFNSEIPIHWLQPVVLNFMDESGLTTIQRH